MDTMKRPRFEDITGHNDQDLKTLQVIMTKMMVFTQML